MKKSRRSELNPESWTKNFRGFIMRKKHDYEARLKYMKMLEEGHSVSSISRQYGIDHRILSTLWMRYKKEGPVALVKKKNCTFTVAEKIAVISEYREKHLSLPDIMLSHGVSRSAIKGWCRRYASGGGEALVDKPRGRRRKDMGRPKKKKPEEMTELERLRYENERLRAENALLKKVKALVEEREARLKGTGRKPSKD